MNSLIIRDEYTRNIALKKIKQLDLKKEMVMTLKQYAHKRSEAQNALYWKWVGIIADHLGYTKKELHIIVADMFLEPDIVEYKGKRVEAIRSTTKLNVHEFTEYLKQIEIWAGVEFSIVLPRPEDLYFQAMGYERKGRK